MLRGRYRVSLLKEGLNLPFRDAVGVFHQDKAIEADP